MPLYLQHPYVPPHGLVLPFFWAHWIEDCWNFPFLWVSKVGKSYRGVGSVGAWAGGVPRAGVCTWARGHGHHGPGSVAGGWSMRTCLPPHILAKTGLLLPLVKTCPRAIRLSHSLAFWSLSSSDFSPQLTRLSLSLLSQRQCSIRAVAHKHLLLFLNFQPALPFLLFPSAYKHTYCSTIFEKRLQPCTSLSLPVTFLPPSHWGLLRSCSQPMLPHLSDACPGGEASVSTSLLTCSG